MIELQALVVPKPPQRVLVRGHAGRVINTLSKTQPRLAGGAAPALADARDLPDTLGDPRAQTRNPKTCILHPTPYTLHPTPYTLHPTPYTLHPTPYTRQTLRPCKHAPCASIVARKRATLLPRANVSLTANGGPLVTP